MGLVTDPRAQQSRTSGPELLPPQTPIESRPILLDIAGEELVLRGRFDHWVPVATESVSADEGAAQFFLDVTAVARPSGHGSAEDLFSFRSREVERIGPHAFRAGGQMQQGDAVAEIQAVVQSPAAHTPFAIITFTVDRRVLGDLWAQVETAVGARTEDGEEKVPRAWLRPPTLALA